jgi:hypothetical protein
MTGPVDLLHQAEEEIKNLLLELETVMEEADPASLIYKEAEIYHHHLKQAAEEIALLDT